LKVDSEEEIKRDVFKSETAVLMIPELELELTSGTLGGLYTTVEGLIEKILDHIKENNPFLGDSSENNFRNKMDAFFVKLEELKCMKHKWTLIIDDPMDNSFVQNPNFPNEDSQVVSF
jgi:zinc finger protein